MIENAELLDSSEIEESSSSSSSESEKEQTVNRSARKEWELYPFQEERNKGDDAHRISKKKKSTSSGSSSPDSTDDRTGFPSDFVSQKTMSHGDKKEEQKSLDGKKEYTTGETTTLSVPPQNVFSPLANVSRRNENSSEEEKEEKSTTSDSESQSDSEESSNDSSDSTEKRAEKPIRQQKLTASPNQTQFHEKEKHQQQHLRHRGSSEGIVEKTRLQFQSKEREGEVLKKLPEKTKLKRQKKNGFAAKQLPRLAVSLSKVEASPLFLNDEMDEEGDDESDLEPDRMLKEIESGSEGPFAQLAALKTGKQKKGRKKKSDKSLYSRELTPLEKVELATQKNLTEYMNKEQSTLESLRLHECARLPPKTPKDYQWEVACKAFHEQFKNWGKPGGKVIALEMGLGKTYIMLMVVELYRLFQKQVAESKLPGANIGKPKPVLIVATKAGMKIWLEEIAQKFRWTPNENKKELIVWYGNRKGTLRFYWKNMMKGLPEKNKLQALRNSPSSIAVLQKIMEACSESHIVIGTYESIRETWQAAGGEAIETRPLIHKPPAEYLKYEPPNSIPVPKKPNVLCPEVFLSFVPFESSPTTSMVSTATSSISSSSSLSSSSSSSLFSSSLACQMATEPLVLTQEFLNERALLVVESMRSKEPTKTDLLSFPNAEDDHLFDCTLTEGASSIHFQDSDPESNEIGEKNNKSKKRKSFGQQEGREMETNTADSSFSSSSFSKLGTATSLWTKKRAISSLPKNKNSGGRRKKRKNKESKSVFSHSTFTSTDTLDPASEQLYTLSPLHRFKFDVLIADETKAIKKFMQNQKVSKRSLAFYDLQYGYIYLITGTPIETGLTDLRIIATYCGLELALESKIWKADQELNPSEQKEKKKKLKNFIRSNVYRITKANVNYALYPDPKAPIIRKFEFTESQEIVDDLLKSCISVFQLNGGHNKENEGNKATALGISSGKRKKSANSRETKKRKSNTTGKTNKQKSDSITTDLTTEEQRSTHSTCFLPNTPFPFAGSTSFPPREGSSSSTAFSSNSSEKEGSLGSPHFAFSSAVGSETPRTLEHQLAPQAFSSPQTMISGQVNYFRLLLLYNCVAPEVALGSLQQQIRNKIKNYSRDLEVFQKGEKEEQLKRTELQKIEQNKKSNEKKKSLTLWLFYRKLEGQHLAQSEKLLPIWKVLWKKTENVKQKLFVIQQNDLLQRLNTLPSSNASLASNPSHSSLSSLISSSLPSYSSSSSASSSFSSSSTTNEASGMMHSLSSHQEMDLSWIYYGKGISGTGDKSRLSFSLSQIEDASFCELANKKNFSIEYKNKNRFCTNLKGEVFWDIWTQSYLGQKFLVIDQYKAVLEFAQRYIVQRDREMTEIALRHYIKYKKPFVAPESHWDGPHFPSFFNIELFLRYYGGRTSEQASNLHQFEAKNNIWCFGKFMEKKCLDWKFLYYIHPPPKLNLVHWVTRYMNPSEWFLISCPSSIDFRTLFKPVQKNASWDLSASSTYSSKDSLPDHNTEELGERKHQTNSLSDSPFFSFSSSSDSYLSESAPCYLIFQKYLLSRQRQNSRKNQNQNQNPTKPTPPPSVKNVSTKLKKTSHHPPPQQQMAPLVELEGLLFEATNSTTSLDPSFVEVAHDEKEDKNKKQQDEEFIVLLSEEGIGAKIKRSFLHLSLLLQGLFSKPARSKKQAKPPPPSPPDQKEEERIKMIYQKKRIRFVVLPKVPITSLKFIVSYLNFWKEDRPKPIKTPFAFSSYKNVMEQKKNILEQNGWTSLQISWHNTFWKSMLEENESVLARKVYEVILAANYLGILSLLEFCCFNITLLIRGKMVETETEPPSATTTSSSILDSIEELLSGSMADENRFASFRSNELRKSKKDRFWPSCVTKDWFPPSSLSIPFYLYFPCQLYKTYDPYLPIIFFERMIQKPTTCDYNMILRKKEIIPATRMYDIDDRKNLIQLQNKGFHSIMFISMLAGGASINLSMADLIWFPSQNGLPAYDAQAAGRVQRIGQIKGTQTVKTLCFYTRKKREITMEAYIFYNRSGPRYHEQQRVYQDQNMQTLQMNQLLSNRPSEEAFSQFKQQFQTAKQASHFSEDKVDLTVKDEQKKEKSLELTQKRINNEQKQEVNAILKNLPPPILRKEEIFQESEENKQQSQKKKEFFSCQTNQTLPSSFSMCFFWFF